MRAAVFESLTGPAGVSIVDRQSPVPSPDEVVVAVDAAALNRHDLRVLQGDSDYVGTEQLPFLSGLDLAGVVEAVGDAVTRVAPGDRVVGYPVETCGRCRFCRDGPENRCANLALFHGAFAERAVVPADQLLDLPRSVGTVAAAALPSAYLTAWRMLERAGVTAGDRLLVPGATGGVGVATVQLAALRGAETIGTSSSTSKLERLAPLGADQTIAASEPGSIAAEVGEIGPIDVVVNHLGGAFTQLGIEVLRTGGRMVICGGTASYESTIDVADLYRSHVEILGSSVGTKPDLQRVLDLVADGAFSPAVDREFPLAEARRGFERLSDREAVGKVMLRP